MASLPSSPAGRGPGRGGEQQDVHVELYAGPRGDLRDLFELAEDSAVLRDGLTELLTVRGLEVAAAVGTGEDLLAAVAEHRPQVAVVDVRMPPTHTDEGVRAARPASATC